MTNNTVNALLGYFEALYNMNKSLIALCGMDIFNHSGQNEKLLQDTIQAAPRLVPYLFDIKADKYIINYKDGLLEFSDELPFLLPGYESILKNHYDFLSKVKKLRNKFEHKIHGARLTASESGSGHMFKITYTMEDDSEFSLSDNEFINFIKDMNLLFAKIQKEVEKYMFTERKEDNPYLLRLTRVKFDCFIKIYDSDILVLIGKSMFPF